MNCLLKRTLPFLSLTALLSFSHFVFAEETPDSARIQQIAAMLPAPPTGMGQPITNRVAWKELAAQHPELKRVISQAAKRAAQPLPPQPDDLFLEYSKNGNRTRWEKAENSRRSRIALFTLAECLENKGRFIAPLEAAIAAVCAEHTWVLSAHDASLRNFHGNAFDVDLGTAALGADLATAYYLLGDKLSPATRQLIRDNLNRRIFTSYHAAIAGKSRGFWWLHSNNNWNAVCLDGVTASALAVIESPTDRAWYIAVAEKNIQFYLAGFTPDGYCVEGLGYWNYGFGNFAELAENIRQSTGGQIDLLTDSAAVQPALFGARTEIIHGVYPTIADSHPGEQPAADLMNFLNRRFDWQLLTRPETIAEGNLYREVLMDFLPADLPVIHTANTLDELPWRTCFPLGGVFIFRPGPDSAASFAVCVKGGNNGVNHGHNDVGSFSVVNGQNMIICDPGGEVYTSRTFSPHRYDSKVLNSFGHAVPIIAGQLQHAGIDAKAVILATNFTAAADTLTFDLRSAYSVAELQKMERTFIYRRGKSPALTVRDQVAYSAPETFESALITWGTINQIGDNEVQIDDGGDVLRVQIDTGGQPFHLKQETINEDVPNHRQPIHLGIVLDNKITTATVTLRIIPG